jgi:PAS domain S-box-containing protein
LLELIKLSYSDLINQSRSWVYGMQRTSRTVKKSAGLKEFGYTKEQVEGGMTLYDFISPNKQEEIRESNAQAGFGEPSEWIEVPGLRRDGSTFAASARAS